MEEEGGRWKRREEEGRGGRRQRGEEEKRETHVAWHERCAVCVACVSAVGRCGAYSLFINPRLIN